MPVDNSIYDRPGDLWWGDDSPLAAIRTALNPGRLEYLGRVSASLGIDLRGKTVLDLGCGGGLLAEELGRLGGRVTGIDPAEASLAVARDHAVSGGLEIEYLAGSGEALPLPDASFDIVCCCDVLEHVDDLEKVISETSRALKPGGLYLYDTINRTLRSRLVLVKLLQEWSWTTIMPQDLHDWHQFIRPSELVSSLGRHGLRSLGYTGLQPAAGPLALLRFLRQQKRGRLTAVELGERAVMKLSRDTSILYIGHAVKDGGLSRPVPRS
ncbi:MAG: bifunctional 2-polyprenyl-6-hydroxyphenol methylase/3-demethylubiquinol 3-O-methyltransferase UbiG [Candidatus Dormibacteraeota bacterium]|uniref:bifunctional 2-polyprenyl-6-hydroxyphenol methylase/3-demethylubiquinol 3-O-methyltransferase UbiG n=1 Tax=Candidatus Dormibacter sp. TaxID=2973982 RepID=UPI000DB6D8C2|nr:bifunctional 2-polyprenyl-6-hydroxyphenol methylase/3-demethylubiquinol 3-O-methyltransferase UbiG [Candidatus Dormibacteraeota bacterium]PZR66139.1 MAG: 3-demethylubiquinone-9 3-O-methyltransferase [Candidatus Dormibacteraeota bacterium]